MSFTEALVDFAGRLSFALQARYTKNSILIASIFIHGKLQPDVFFLIFFPFLFLLFFFFLIFSSVFKYVFIGAKPVFEIF